jgi:hypothetical protein
MDLSSPIIELREILLKVAEIDKAHKSLHNVH